MIYSPRLLSLTLLPYLCRFSILSLERPYHCLHRHVQETVTDYYRKISPRDAWLLERKVAPAATSS